MLHKHYILHTFFGVHCNLPSNLELESSRTSAISKNTENTALISNKIADAENCTFYYSHVQLFVNNLPSTK